MSKNISIDELFRAELSEGKEQLNLGAWANMERMLDGKNPYSVHDEEFKKKKRILPFWIFLAGLSALVSIGALYIFNSKSNKADIAESISPKIQNKSALSSLEQSADTKEIYNDSENITPSNQLMKTSKIENVKLEKEKQVPTKSIQYSQKSYQIDNPNTDENTEIINIEKTKTKKSIQHHKEIIKVADAKPTIANTSMNEVDDNSKNIIKSDNEINVIKRIPSQQIFANEIVNKNRNGNISSVQLDTIEKIQNEIVNPKIEEEKNIEVLVAKPENEQYHARYVAGLKNTEPEVPITLDNKNNLQSNFENISISNNQKSKTNPEKIKSKETMFGTVGAVLVATLSKIAESSNDFFSLFKVLDPGLSVGVNAALFKTKHQYGGFHLGVTNRTEISSTFSIISELKYFLKNNAGFTINDIQTNIKDKAIDTMSAPGSTIYSYMVDSLTKRYNFSNFMSLELPIMLNAKFNQFSIYAGPNFIYNFKLKVNEVNKNYYISKQELVSNNTVFEYPETKSLQYSRDDFRARFGIGYAIGVSYNFNPKIYVDLRLNKALWDNMKYNSERSISNGVTNVPFIQLSLGYKFLNNSK